MLPRRSATRHLLRISLALRKSLPRLITSRRWRCSVLLQRLGTWLFVMSSHVCIVTRSDAQLSRTALGAHWVIGSRGARTAIERLLPEAFAVAEARGGTR